MRFYPEKKWKIRASSDPEYMKLGSSEEVRTQRADSIDRDRRQFRMWVIGILVAILVGIPLLSSIRQDGWLPTYYPNPLDLTTYSNGPVLESLEQCRDWIDDEAIRRGQEPGEYDYECGLNCELDNQYGFFVCDETLQ